MGNNPISGIDPDGGFSGTPFIELARHSADGLIRSFQYSLTINWGVLGNALGNIATATSRTAVSSAPYLFQAAIGGLTNFARISDSGDVTAESLKLGKDKTAENVISKFMQTSVGSYIEGDEIGKIRPGVEKASIAISRITHVAGGLEVDLTWKAKLVLTMVPKLSVSKDARISVTREVWGDGKTSVMHLKSDNITMPDGARTRNLDIYINNDGYTFDKKPTVDKNGKSSVPYYSILKGKW